MSAQLISVDTHPDDGLDIDFGIGVTHTELAGDKETGVGISFVPANSALPSQHDPDEINYDSDDGNPAETVAESKADDTNVLAASLAVPETLAAPVPSGPCTTDEITWDDEPEAHPDDGSAQDVGQQEAPASGCDEPKGDDLVTGDQGQSPSQDRHDSHDSQPAIDTGVDNVAYYENDAKDVSKYDDEHEAFTGETSRQVKHAVHAEYANHVEQDGNYIGEYQNGAEVAAEAEGLEDHTFPRNDESVVGLAVEVEDAGFPMGADEDDAMADDGGMEEEMIETGVSENDATTGEESAGVSTADVEVFFAGNHYCLFRHPEDPDIPYILEDSLLQARASEVLDALQDALGDEINDGDELVVQVEDLCLEISPMMAPTLQAMSISDFAHLHAKLVSNDGSHDGPPLRLTILARPSFSSRYQELLAGVRQGFGLSQLRRKFDTGQGTVYTSPVKNEVGDIEYANSASDYEKDQEAEEQDLSNGASGEYSEDEYGAEYPDDSGSYNAQGPIHDVEGNPGHGLSHTQEEYPEDFEGQGQYDDEGQYQEQYQDQEQQEGQEQYQGPGQEQYDDQDQGEGPEDHGEYDDGQVYEEGGDQVDPEQAEDVKNDDSIAAAAPDQSNSNIEVLDAKAQIGALADADANMDADVDADVDVGADSTYWANHPLEKEHHTASADTEVSQSSSETVDGDGIEEGDGLVVDVALGTTAPLDEISWEVEDEVDPEPPASARKRQHPGDEVDGTASVKRRRS